MFSQAVLSAAADAALLWWTRVLPALLPYLILTGLAVRCRPRLSAVGRLHPYALLSLLLGAIGGYPVGARVLGEGLQTGALSEREARRFSLAASLPSPSFLISVTALGLFACPARAPHDEGRSAGPGPLVDEVDVPVVLPYLSRCVVVELPK